MVEADLQRYAVAVLFLQVRGALLDFPTSDRAHPSYTAYLQLSPGYADRMGHRDYFPMRVPWNVWEGVCVPVASDETLRVQVERNRELILLGNYKALLVQITAALKREAQARGFLAAESA